MTTTPTIVPRYEHISTVVAERQSLLHALHRYLRRHLAIAGATYIITEPDRAEIPCQSIQLIYTGKIDFGQVDTAFHAAQAYKSGWRQTS